MNCHVDLRALGPRRMHNRMFKPVFFIWSNPVMLLRQPEPLRWYSRSVLLHGCHNGHGLLFKSDIGLQEVRFHVAAFHIDEVEGLAGTRAI